MENGVWCCCETESMVCVVCCVLVLDHVPQSTARVCVVANRSFPCRLVVDPPSSVAPRLHHRPRMSAPAAICHSSASLTLVMLCSTVGPHHRPPLSPPLGTWHSRVLGLAVFSTSSQFPVRTLNSHTSNRHHPGHPTRGHTLVRKTLPEPRHIFASPQVRRIVYWLFASFPTYCVISLPRLCH